MAVYNLSPVLSLHVVALGGSATQVGVLFSLFALVAVVLRPLAGVWIDRHGIRPALLTGAALVVDLAGAAGGGVPWRSSRSWPSSAWASA